MVISKEFPKSPPHLTAAYDFVNWVLLPNIRSQRIQKPLDVLTEYYKNKSMFDKNEEFDLLNIQSILLNKLVVYELANNLSVEKKYGVEIEETWRALTLVGSALILPHDLDKQADIL